MSIFDSGRASFNEIRSLTPTVGLYLLLTFSLSAISYFLAPIATKNGGELGSYFLMLMWSPAVAAFITLLYNGRSIRNDLNWKWPTTQYVLVSWYLPIVYTLISYIVVWISGEGEFPNKEFMNNISKSLGLGLSPVLSTVIYIIITGTFGMATAMSSALGEEIGWRGFLLPELIKSFDFTTSSIIVGLVWSIWHYPLIVFTDYSSTTPWWYQLICFTIYVTSLSVIFAWVRFKSGSLWTGAILHGSQNLYMQEFFTPLTGDTGRTAWFIDEFGFVLPITSFLTAVYFWRRRGELELGVRLPL